MLNLRAIDAKGLSEEVILMRWNPNMDLLALVFKNGDITLNRLLSWQRVWRIPFPPPSTIKDIAWRPDGRILAICYDTENNGGIIVVDKLQDKTSVCSLHNVENGDVINTIHIEDGLITSLGWFVYKPLNGGCVYAFEDDCIDISMYLPEMHPLPTSYGVPGKRAGLAFGAQANTGQQSATQTTSDALSSLLASDQPNLNLLAIATNKGCIKFHALGLYDVGSLELDCSLMETPITNIFLSSCMRYITVIQEKQFEDPSQVSTECSRRSNETARYSRSSARNSPSTSRRSRANVDTSNLSRTRSSSFNEQNTISSSRRQSSITSEVAKVSKFNYSLRVVEINTFSKRSHEVLRVSKMYAKILSELQYLDEVMKAITGSWEDVLAGLDTKLSSYCSRRVQKQQANSVQTSNGYTLLTADEFLQLLVIGHLSDNLEKFLHDLSDKGLKKLNQAIEQTCSKVQDLVVRDAQKCCYHLHNDLNTLRGMSKWRERYGDVGLDETTIVVAMKSVGSLLLKLTELQQVIDHSLKSAKSFFRWLNSVINRASTDSNMGMVTNEILMTTQQDIQFITDFIQENFDYSPDEFKDPRQGNRGDEDSFERPTCSNFTLEQVGQYLKNEPLTRQKYSFINPGANFWIDFIKDKPELSENTLLGEDGKPMLLFYPHNPETSLIQEHVRADRLIREAFISVSSNITQTLSKGDIIIEMDEFITGTKGFKTTRMCVETDPLKNQHYCLFLTEDCPSYKLYLIAMALDTNKCRLIHPRLLKLESISHLVEMDDYGDEDHAPKSIEQFLVADFKFFTPSVISFLLIDENIANTYLVQIHMDQFKLHEQTRQTKWWSATEISEILTSQEAMEHQRETISVNIDINSSSQKRKLNPSIVYKRVKSVIGIDMAVVGQRKLACFTTDENKKIHLYELESCDPEEELEDEERSQDGDGKDECSSMEVNRRS